MAEIVVEDEGADPEPLGGRRDRGQGRDRGQLLDEMIREDEDVDADRLRVAGALGEGLAVDDGVGRREKPEGSHGDGF